MQASRFLGSVFICFGLVWVGLGGRGEARSKKGPEKEIIVCVCVLVGDDYRLKRPIAICAKNATAKAIAGDVRISAKMKSGLNMRTI